MSKENFAKILEKIENFGFFGKFRIIISKVGGKSWRREGYIIGVYFNKIQKNVHNKMQVMSKLKRAHPKIL